MMIINKKKAEEKFFYNQNYVNPEEVKNRINADYLVFNCWKAVECYREMMVSYFPMLPLIEKQVVFQEADYILYAHPYARLEENYIKT